MFVTGLYFEDVYSLKLSISISMSANSERCHLNNRCLNVVQIWIGQRIIASINNDMVTLKHWKNQTQQTICSPFWFFLLQKTGQERAQCTLISYITVGTRISQSYYAICMFKWHGITIEVTSVLSHITILGRRGVYKVFIQFRRNVNSTENLIKEGEHWERC